MTNKLKKENNILIKADKEYSKKFPKDRLQVDLNYARILIKQAKLSQKQEDDEKFEKMIDELEFVHMVGVKELKSRIKGENKK